MNLIKIRVSFICLFVICLTTGTTVRAQQNWDKNSVATTPPMGWNSYDCYGAAVTESEVKANADYVAKHLKPYGWDYIVVDFCWYYPQSQADLKVSPPWQKIKADGSMDPQLTMDRYGRLMPVVKKFPSAASGMGFKKLGDYIHSLGLKFGIHIMRGIPREAVNNKMPIFGAKGIDASMIANRQDTCTWLNHMYGINMEKPGAQKYLNSLFALYSSWGVDFVKVDDITRPYHQKEIEGYQKAIQHSGRKMVLSLSPGATPLADADHVVKFANQWRLADDFWDRWDELVKMFDLADKWHSYIGPGHWPDLDMIPIGILSKRGPVGKERRSRFTDNEQRILMTLWCIARSPLFLGGDLPMNTDRELALESNTEVLNVNQTGSSPHKLYRQGDLLIWVSRAKGNNKWNVAMFNLSEQTQNIIVQFSDLGINTKAKVRDLWEKRDLGVYSKELEQNVSPHDAKLVTLQAE